MRQRKSLRKAIGAALCLTGVAVVVWYARSPATKIAIPEAPSSQSSIAHESTRSNRAEAQASNDATRLAKADRRLGSGLLIAIVQSWGSRNDISLTPGEVTQLYDLLASIQVQHLRHEAEIAEVEQEISDRERIIVIPPYPELGAKLRDIWADGAAGVLGPERARSLLAAVENDVSSVLSSWGEFDQQLLVKSIPEKKTYAITHRMLLRKRAGDVSEPVRISESTLRSNQLLQYTLLEPSFPRF